MLAAILKSQEGEAPLPEPEVTPQVTVYFGPKPIRYEFFTQRTFFVGTFVTSLVFPISLSFSVSVRVRARTEPLWTESKTFMAHGRTVSRVYHLTMLFKLYLEAEDALED